ncbi:MAG: hypothetical protein SVY15_02430 [Halobacteriota archaeon]|nr:hypothetical protein [Halobacteriota archaeon]
MEIQVVSEGMSLEKLWRILDAERKSAGLQNISPSFYKDASEYIKELELELSKTGPEDPKAIILVDELKTARMRIENIFNKRIGKIINLASSKACGLSKIPNGFIENEKDIFEKIVKIIEQAKSSVLENALICSENKESSPKTTVDVSEREVKEDCKAVQSPILAMDGFSVLRVLKDIPTFVGSDGRNYKLGEEDIIVLPKSNADILCAKGAALKIPD